MNRLISSPILISVLLLVSWSFAQNRIGLLGGRNEAKLAMEPSDSLQSGNTTLGGNGFGGVLELRLGKYVGLRLEPMYIEKGSRQKYIDPSFGKTTRSQVLKAIDLPVLLKLSFTRQRIAPYLLGGGFFSYFLEARETFEYEFSEPGVPTEFDNEDMFKQTDFGYTFGAGFAINLGRLGLFAEGRYSKGILDIYNVEDAPGKLRTEGLAYFGGITIAFGGNEIVAQRKGDAPAGSTGEREKTGSVIDSLKKKYPGFDPPIGEDDEPRIWGEELDEQCPLDIDIHRPAAQGAATPVIPEATDATMGAYTLRNDDIDVPTNNLLQNRLRNRGKLLTVEGIPDLSFKGAINREDDLAQVDLFNPTMRNAVFLNAYAVATEDPAGKKVPRRKGFQPLQRGKLRFWSTARRTGEIKLPYRVKGPMESIYVEGLKAGRYRLVIFYIPNGKKKKARAVKAKETGDPHTTPAQAAIKLKPNYPCRRNVRLTVAITDIKQKTAREHVFDVLWGGRALIDADVWPPGGNFQWSNNRGLAATWETGNLRGTAVQARAAAPGGNIENITQIHGGFVPQAGAAVAGSQEYEHRLQLNYTAENVVFERTEPLTIMVPDHVTINGFTRFNRLRFIRSRNKVKFSVKYQLFDQINRKLIGPGNTQKYENQYGTRLQMYEALGMGTNAAETNDNVRMQYQSTATPAQKARARSFSFGVKTRQRSNALPQKGSLSDGNFSDQFSFIISKNQRTALQQDLREREPLNRPGTNPVRIFSVRQDVVALLRNGVNEYDVRVARGNTLEIWINRNRRGVFGNLGFKFILGGAGGAQLNTGNPDRVGTNHNP